MILGFSLRNLILPILLTAGLVLLVIYRGTTAYAAADCSQTAVGTACLYLQPAVLSVNQNTDFSVQVRANINGVSTNAVQANLTFPTDKLQGSSIDSIGGVFDLQAQKEINNSNGTITIGLGSVAVKTGDVLLATINFKSKNVAGLSTVSFANNSAVVSSTTNGNILGSTVGGSYTILEAVTATPTETTIISTPTATPLVTPSLSPEAANGSDTTKPSRPQNLQGTAISSTQINLTWDSAADNVGITGYEVYRSSKLIATVTTTSFGDSGLKPNISYSYRVRALDQAGNRSGNSKFVTVRTQKEPVTAGNIFGVVTDNTNNPICFTRVKVKVVRRIHTVYTNCSGS
jgi:hypothetical protein